MCLPCCLHTTLFRCAVMPWSNVNFDIRRYGAVCCRWHVAVLAVLFARSLLSFFCLDLNLISTCVVLAPCTVDSSSPFLLINLSFCLCIHMSACLSFYLSTYIYLFVCLSVCLSVSTGCRSVMSSQHELVARRCRPWCLFDVPSCCMTMWLPCCLHATLFRCAVMP